MYYGQCRDRLFGLLQLLFSTGANALVNDSQVQETGSAIRHSMNKTTRRYYRISFGAPTRALVAALFLCVPLQPLFAEPSSDPQALDAAEQSVTMPLTIVVAEARDAMTPAPEKTPASAKKAVKTSRSEPTKELIEEPGEVTPEVIETQPKPVAEGAPIVSSPPVAKLPQAKSVELNEPVITPSIVVQDNVIAPVVEGTPDAESKTDAAAAAPEPVAATEVKPLVILGTEILPSTATRLSWSPSQSFEGIATPTPVLIVNGAKQGPVLCLTAALHGDELNGIEIVRRVLYQLEPENLSGSVIGVPIVNLQGFRRSSRYLTDRRDLNRYFPGNPQGSSASRIAHSFFTEVISHCDALVDLHTGSFYRTNLPQLRADLSNPQVVELAKGFGSTVVLQSGGAVGTLRRAAVDAGIPAVTLEAGESMGLQEQAVEHGVKGIHTLMNKMGMMQKFSFWGDPEPVYYHSVWVRADLGGILFSTVELGDRVKKGDLLGDVRDPITNISQQIVSPRDGRVIGMALNQVVLPGFAAFHIGIRAPKESLPEPDQSNPDVPLHISSTQAEPPSRPASAAEVEPSDKQSAAVEEAGESALDDVSEDVDEPASGEKRSDVDEYD